MAQKQKKPQSMKYFRYRLADQPHVPAQRMGLEGSILSKPVDGNPNWLVTRNKIDKLHKHILTKDNPQGFVEYEEFNPLDANAAPMFAPNLSGEVTFYTRDELFMMERAELEAAGKAVGINPANIKTDNLIKKIVQEQKRFEKPEVPAEDPEDKTEG